MPKISSASCDLSIFVDEPAQSIDPHDPHVRCWIGVVSGTAVSGEANWPIAEAPPGRCGKIPPATAHLAEGSRDAIAGTDLGRLCDDRAGGLRGAGHASVSAPTPLNLAAGRVLILIDASLRNQPSPRSSGRMIKCGCLASADELEQLTQPGAPDDRGRRGHPDTLALYIRLLGARRPRPAQPERPPPSAQLKRPRPIPAESPGSGARGRPAWLRPPRGSAWTPTPAARARSRAGPHPSHRPVRLRPAGHD